MITRIGNIAITSPFCMKWLIIKKKKKTISDGQYVVWQVEREWVKFCLIISCTLSSCFWAGDEEVVEFPVLCLSYIINAYVVFWGPQSSFHMEMYLTIQGFNLRLPISYSVKLTAAPRVCNTFSLITPRLLLLFPLSPFHRFQKPSMRYKLHVQKY